MIKKVLAKNKTKIIKKFPEYDSTKMYISANDTIIKKSQHEYISRGLDASRGCIGFTSFKELSRFYGDSVYILKNFQDLTNYLEGSRNFPILKEIEEEITVPLDKDEVLMPNYFDKRKIYGLKGITHNIYILCMVDSKYSFVSLDRPWMTFNGSFNTIIELIETVDEFNDGVCPELFNQVYQFDTYQEFLEWSLEQITCEGNT